MHGCIIDIFNDNLQNHYNCSGFGAKPLQLYWFSRKKEKKVLVEPQNIKQMQFWKVLYNGRSHIEEFRNSF